jgi:uncharacterized RDD family membrane protein YckC
MSEQTWYFARNEKQEGPVDESELIKLFVEGQLFGDTLVWCEDFEEWKAASKVEVFADKIKKKSPPPLPEGTTSPPPIRYTASQRVTSLPPAIMEAAMLEAGIGKDASSMEKAHPGPHSAANPAAPAPTQAQAAAPTPAPAKAPTPAQRAAANPAPAVVQPQAPSAPVQSAASPSRAPTPTSAPAPTPAPKPQPQPCSSEELLRPHPWHRYFARYIDSLWATIAAAVPALLFWVVGDALLSGVPDMKWIAGFMAYFIFMLVYMCIEPMMLMMFGTTLGKALYNIRLRQINGTRLTPGQALSRTWWVFVFSGGILFFIPFAPLIVMIIDYMHLQRDGVTKWDRGKYRYEHHPMTGGRWAGVVAAIFIGGSLPGIFATICMIIIGASSR